MAEEISGEQEAAKAAKAAATVEAEPATREAPQPAEETPEEAAAKARKADEMAARSWARQRERILERLTDKEVARDVATLAGMTEIYCADHHDAAARVPFESEAVAAGVYPPRKIPKLCPECAAHLRYGEVRRALCQRDPRPSCKTCERHCYAPDESAWQRRAMAYAGPRAMFRGHARDAFRHLIQTRLS